MLHEPTDLSGNPYMRCARNNTRQHYRLDRSARYCAILIPHASRWRRYLNDLVVQACAWHADESPKHLYYFVVYEQPSTVTKCSDTLCQRESRDERKGSKKVWQVTSMVKIGCVL